MNITILYTYFFMKFFCADGELSTESSFDGVQHQGGGLRGLQVREQELPRWNRIYRQALRSVIWYLYIRWSLRICLWRKTFSDYFLHMVTAMDLNKCLKQIKLPVLLNSCVPISELPSNIRRMVPTLYLYKGLGGSVSSAMVRAVQHRYSG